MYVVRIVELAGHTSHLNTFSDKADMPSKLWDRTEYTVANIIYKWDKTVAPAVKLMLKISRRIKFLENLLMITPPIPN